MAYSAPSYNALTFVMRTPYVVPAIDSLVFAMTDQLPEKEVNFAQDGLGSETRFVIPMRLTFSSEFSMAKEELRLTNPNVMWVSSSQEKPQQKIVFASDLRLESEVPEQYLRITNPNSLAIHTESPGYELNSEIKKTQVLKFDIRLPIGKTNFSIRPIQTLSIYTESYLPDVLAIIDQRNTINFRINSPGVFPYFNTVL